MYLTSRHRSNQIAPSINQFKLKHSTCIEARPKLTLIFLQLHKTVLFFAKETCAMIQTCSTKQGCSREQRLALRNRELFYENIMFYAT